MSSTTVVAGTEVSLIDLSLNEEHPANVTLEIKDLKKETYDLTKDLIEEVRQDPWEQTDTYTLAEFKSWYGDYFGEMAWEMAELNQLKDRLTQFEIINKKLKNKLKKLRKKHNKKMKQSEYNIAFAEYEAEEAKYHSRMATKKKTQ